MKIDIKAILGDKRSRFKLMVGTIIATQAREGIQTTRQQAIAAYEKALGYSMTIQTQVAIFRKSTNRNSFGLRGYWCVESKPTTDRTSLRVFEFATSDDLPMGEQSLPFFVDGNGEPAVPAFELPVKKATLDPSKYKAFMAGFSITTSQTINQGKS